ncbi:RNA polymerase sigma factor [Micromonospora sp. NPDC007208]|uniref:RNA polymerase sigma factor n=1 Tax=Micromonospora sp. NPDC007208 TaxID=3364236 RepID=UPI00367B3599
MESSLRARVRAGDPGAFAELFDKYARSVYNHAFRLTADWATAEDVMAATYLQAWRSRERVTEEGGSLRPWLLGIATNEARNHTRSNRRYRRVAAALLASDLTLPDHADEVAGRLDDRRRDRRAGPAAPARARGADPVPVGGRSGHGFRTTLGQLRAVAGQAK